MGDGESETEGLFFAPIRAGLSGATGPVIFVPKHLRYNIPEPLADHMARMWRVGVPYEKPIYTISIDSLRVRRIEGDFFAGQLTVVPDVRP